MINCLVLIIALCLSTFVHSQKDNISPIQLNEIMKGKDFIGYWPENHFWSADGKSIYFYWNSKNELSSSLHAYSLDSKKIDKIDELKNEIIPFDKNQSEYDDQYFISKGGLWVYNKRNGTKKALISTESSINEVIRLSNPKEVVYRDGNNMFLYSSENGTIKQITSIEKGGNTPSDDNSSKSNELKDQQQALFLYIQEKKEKNEWNLKKNDSPIDKKFYLSGKYLDFLDISKDAKFGFISVADYPNNKSTHVEHHISEDGYSYTQDARPKVGAEEPTHFFYISDFENDTTVRVDFGKLPGIRKKPEYYKEYGDTISEFEIDRKIIFHRPISSNLGITLMDIRSYDNKDRWIVKINSANYSYDVIDHQHDEAWIGGPGISGWNRSTSTLGFWNSENHMYYQSESTGYSHLYSYDFKSNKKTQLTDGQFEVHDVRLSNDGKTFYLTANKIHPGNREFYAFDPIKKSWKSFLTEDGNYDVSLSPDERDLAVIFSVKNTPPELYISENKSPEKLAQITFSKSQEFQKYKWRNPEVISFLGKDKKKVYARLYQPQKEIETGAAVIFVHGAGYLQNAHNYWSSYYREYMFHNLLTDNGYTVLDIDFRASEGYGRDHRTAIYRHMGGWDLEDQISGKNLLVDSLGIDEKRVGIYGGSYGGFITLMALLNRPQEFACGAALRSVTDWMNYNHEYTSNILNYPDTDSIAYWQSSPINFAQNLEKPLLMLHGMVDDNVQFQDVVRLSQRFIELEKKDWNIAIYPIEGHGFVKWYSWADEYRRIFELFQEELNKN